MPVAYVLDELFLGHRAASDHPERPERLGAVREALERVGLRERGLAVPARPATDEELLRVHRPGYLAELARVLPGGSGTLDEDTFYSPGSWDAALHAAGGAVALALASLDGRAPRGFAAVRPPGHHAEPERAMGFCLLNNVAVAAAAARAAGCARVAVVDWDVHHGNGTQEAFYADPTVLYVSTHQYPFYPGTGAAAETGAGAGRGATVNVPLPAGCGDAEYAAAFDEVVAPALRAFRPELILVSAGYDAYVDDPLASMKVTAAGYERMARVVRAVAEEVAGGRVVVVLEGGYDLAGLAAGAAATFEVLAGPPPALPPPLQGPARGARLAIEAVTLAHEGRWFSPVQQ